MINIFDFILDEILGKTRLQSDQIQAKNQGELAMMKQCPACGSEEIVNDLIVFAGEAPSGQRLVYISLQESPPQNKPFVWSPKSVVTGFRASVCGSCGYTAFYTKQHREILEAHKKGFTSQKKSAAAIIPEP
jgi:predicted nucleic-acid-binding Zn-ribbon protein